MMWMISLAHELVQFMAGELRSEPGLSHTESREPLAGTLGAALGTKMLLLLALAGKMAVYLARFPSVIHRALAWERLLLHGPGQSSSGGSLVSACIRAVFFFCLCSMWGDTTGHNRKLFSTWFPKWLPLLFPLRLEDLRHPRGKGR